MKRYRKSVSKTLNTNNNKTFTFSMYVNVCIDKHTP